MKDGKYSVMIVEDQQMPKALFSHFVESSDKFYLQVAIENASVADIVCARAHVDLILMDVVTENGESGLEAAAKIKAKFPKTKIIVARPCNVHYKGCCRKRVRHRKDTFSFLRRRFFHKEPGAFQGVCHRFQNKSVPDCEYDSFHFISFLLCVHYA